MWIMTPFGIIMPASINEDDPNFSEDGLQVRSRERTALTHFQKRYMPAGTFTPVRATPKRDYDFRFYTHRLPFADAVAEMTIEIDYEKFKPVTLRRGMGGEKLHRLYNTIWAEYITAYGTNNIYTNARPTKKRGQECLSTTSRSSSSAKTGTRSTSSDSSGGRSRRTWATTNHGTSSRRQ